MDSALVPRGCLQPCNNSPPQQAIRNGSALGNMYGQGLAQRRAKSVEIQAAPSAYTMKQPPVAIHRRLANSILTQGVYSATAVV